MKEDLTQKRYYLTRPLFVPKRKNELLLGNSPVNIRDFYHKEFPDSSIIETTIAIALDNSRKVIGYTKISTGGTTKSVIESKVVCKFAIDTLAEAIILVHNHPSGSRKISEEDKRITRRVLLALKIINVELTDHVIISGRTKDYTSLRELGIISLMKQKAINSINKLLS